MGLIDTLSSTWQRIRANRDDAGSGSGTDRTVRERSLPVPPVHYLETSAVNYLADHLPDASWNRTLQRGGGFEFGVSSVVLWEVMLNTNVDRREYLLHWMQLNCAAFLLKSPTEIILDFLDRGTPQRERALFAADPETKLPLGRDWRDIHGRPDRTFVLDPQELQKRSMVLREFSKVYARVMDDMVRQGDTTEDPFHRCMLVLFGIDHRLPERDQRLVKTALVLAFFFVCLGIEFHNSVLETFWAPLGVEAPPEAFELRPFKRLDYLIEHWPTAFSRGPLLEMANMLVIQQEVGGHLNRGGLFDAMHALYCYYAANTVSADPHFLALKDRTDTAAYDTIVAAADYVALHKHVRREISAARTPSDDIGTDVR